METEGSRGWLSGSGVFGTPLSAISTAAGFWAVWSVAALWCSPRSVLGLVRTDLGGSVVAGKSLGVLLVGFMAVSGSWKMYLSDQRNWHGGSWSCILAGGFLGLGLYVSICCCGWVECGGFFFYLHVTNTD